MGARNERKADGPCARSCRVYRGTGQAANLANHPPMAGRIVGVANEMVEATEI